MAKNGFKKNQIARTPKPNPDRFKVYCGQSFTLDDLSGTYLTLKDAREALEEFVEEFVQTNHNPLHLNQYIFDVDNGDIYSGGF